MKNILFIDIETDRKGKIQDFGALHGDKELHERNVNRLEQWIKEAPIICGHNILKHDIPELKKVLGESLFEGKTFIDTLLWSPLIFSENPYHHLVKGYKIVNDSDVNNPLSDCKLTKKLLQDEIFAFNDLERNYRRVIGSLLAKNEDFNAFLELGSFDSKGLSRVNTLEALLTGKVCQSVDLEKLAKDYPVELAYAAAIIRLENDESILPSWVRLQYPKSDAVVEKLRFGSCYDSSCIYCTTKLNPKASLQNYFGYTDFRKFDENRRISLQEETVRAGLQNHSFVAVFPTGGGKSLTFQLPALMRGDCTRHLTVVISPLVSLMKDQVDNLEERFQVTKAVAINGLLSPLERAEAFERVEKGGAHILYVSPESLRSPSTFRLISSRAVARFVIDEAHCFSSWGQDFRVDYLYIAEFIKKLQDYKQGEVIPVSCFTATAKPQVINDIKSYFNTRLGLNLKEFITQKGRTNLSYDVIKVEDAESKKKELFRLIRDCEKPAIVYASRTKSVEQLAKELDSAKYPTTFFHGKLDKDEKKKNMESFMSGSKEVIVATSAFGMGVDKEDVRTVIHFNISDSLENYIQEAGRAGRKETIQAKCYILYNESDLNKHFSLLQQTKLNKKEIEEIWKSLKNQAKNRSSISQSSLEIAKSAGWDTEVRDLETKVKTAISALEDRGFLKREQNSPRVFANSLMVKNFAKGAAIINASDTISDQDKRNCERILKRIITDEESRLDYLSDSTELSIKGVQNSIRILRDLNILGDAKDLTAFVNLNRSKNGSDAVLKHHIEIEKGLLAFIDERTSIKISLRQLNQHVLDHGVNSSSVDAILRILNYWEIRKFISKRRIDRERVLYELNVKNNEALYKDITWRHSLARFTIKQLMQIAVKSTVPEDQKDQAPVTFSLLELKEKNSFMGKVAEENSRRYEIALLFLNQIKAIKLEGGFMVSYNKLNIENIKVREKPKFKVEDYAKMGVHYQHKTEQIHIVGEYAKKCTENYEGALEYVNDYFTMDYNEFLTRYFPKRKTEIRRPLTLAKFKEVIKDLDSNQTEILEDNRSDKILVLAGPGSGKTKVLVHKIASLLLLEDVKPEQFLMLTFSKSAAMEFRYRIRELIPEFGGLIKITTFHGFCFELMGQLGDLSKSKNVIGDCLRGIEEGSVDTTMISNKSVLLLDEFQDIDETDWNLIQTIIKTAENIRVIAVGDDDQNIYGFRGSSNKYMMEFKKEYDAKVYTLNKNYRSRAGIIKFNNQLLNKIPNRLKSNELVAAKETKNAQITINKYTGKDLIKPLVSSVSKSEGTKAVLVRTNKEALITSSLLEELGHKTRLIAGFDGFSLDRLEEVRFITELLKSKVNESGLIFDEDWRDSVIQFYQRFHQTPHYDTCMDILRKFHHAYPKKKVLVEWYDYIRQIKIEDAINSEESVIIVSTMHKAKGKEFDHVWLLLEDYEFTDEEAKRLVYVACSRAKASLNIHMNNNFLDDINVDELVKVSQKGNNFPPDYIELILSHRDINLGSQKFPKAIKSIENISTGEGLQKSIVKFAENEAHGLGKNGENLLLFSRDFLNRKINSFNSDGFELVSARVEYLVYWYDKNDEKEYKIVLPRLRFEKVT